MTLPRLILALSSLPLAACSEPSAADAGIDAIYYDGGCTARYVQHALTPGLHVEADASIAWSTNPPSSGTHFGLWVRWGVHTEVVPRGNYVHNEEHGGVVVLYRCIAPDCAPTRTALEAFVNGLPPEPECMGMGSSRRIVLTEDPLIDTPIAAAAWGFTYHADCFDEPSLRAFVLARTGLAPENTCAQGVGP